MLFNYLMVIIAGLTIAAKRFLIGRLFCFAQVVILLP
jgi:hypothetical protein